MTPNCRHGYRHAFDCPECGEAVRAHDAYMRGERGERLQPRNRREARALQTFLRRHPGMRPSPD